MSEAQDQLAAAGRAEPGRRPAARPQPREARRAAAAIAAAADCGARPAASPGSGARRHDDLPDVERTAVGPGGRRDRRRSTASRCSPASEVESLLLDMAPERNREALRNGVGTEWMSEVPDVGRFRCQSFRDHRGPGGIFRMISTRPNSVDQLGLSREIQGLCAETEGLVLVAGPRSSGKSTLITAFVDLINRTRNDYVITIESQIACAHESRGCLISQREVRGNGEELAAAVRAGAAREPRRPGDRGPAVAEGHRARARGDGIGAPGHRRDVGAHVDDGDRPDPRPDAARAPRAGAADAGRRAARRGVAGAAAGRRAADGWPRARCCSTRRRSPA